MRGFLVSVAAVALVAAGCTQSAGNTAAPTPAPPLVTSPLPAPTHTPPAVAPLSCDITVSTNTGHKPTVTFPKTCRAPAALESKDIVAGSGAPVTFGQTPVVQYVGITLSDHKQFDASWDRHQPSEVPNIGQSSAIEGWNQGVLGMRTGGRRLLVVPPDLGYGANGNGTVGPDETLVFVIDLVQIKP